ncbi:MAG TPA: acyl-CoA dehydrogenase, partial [Thiotrichales bacterium]|nr:acyl-CoA dehydrogenase [Thiotrichales bacterium]
MIYWTLAFVLLVSAAAYLRLPLRQWSILLGIMLLAFSLFASAGSGVTITLWLTYFIIVIPLNVSPLRRALISKAVFNGMKKVMPTISQTEQEALDAGDVWWEAELFSGKPDFDVIRQLPKPALNKEEQAFIDGPVETFCKMLDDWKITHEDYDLPPEAWQFAKDNGFFAMIIPKQYGGLEYSALCHSQAVMKIGSRSGSAGVTVMVPNSLGPGKLLMTYGTEEQKDYYLPRLAKGQDIPCFGLTGPDAGSDAGAMPDTGIICRQAYNGEPDVLGIRLNFEKRYITLAPVATILGIAFKLYDPDHLLSDVEERGITLALIKRDTDGVEIGKRHFPANQAFMNGPIRGRDVFIPLDDIIGGADYIGRGWSMLMECLGDGRAISLPALGAASGKMSARYTGAYARIRSQFHTPIGNFEGVEEVLTKIAGQAYAMDSARLMILSALDAGTVPSVLSGAVKQQTMERLRQVINYSMDIHGGHGICMGPGNFLGRAYQLIPVGITVEGANILTRTMIIFGQGAMRSHPFLLKEVEAVHNANSLQGLQDFDRALFAHIGFVISNKVRSFWLGLTGARFTATPGNRHTRYYYQQVVRMSAAFAFLADIC